MVGESGRVQRRLAAIFALDVVGSSRLMEVNESATLAAIQSILAEAVAPAAARHQGRLVKTMGDGALVEFASPVEAVLCATEVQAAMAGRPDRTRLGLELRIGINLGDVVIAEDGDIYGDAVNIAVRLEGIADPGALCVSGKVFDELEGKLSLPFEDRGEQRLKNIARPIRVYSLRGDSTSPREPQAVRPTPKHNDKPSIAVLPFSNLSGDPAQDYLAEGVADDILTALAQSRWLFVMARSSSFAFKGRAIETDQVARRLGVRYILTGSVRRSGDHVRISAQLTDAETGGSLWAERYDRDVTDVLTLQDEIAEAVAGAIEPELLKTESQRGAARPQSMEAWDLVRRGMWEFHKIKPEGHRLARELFLKAIEADPNSADGYIWLARAEAGLAAYGWTDHSEAIRQAGMVAGLKAVQLDARNPYAHYAVAISHIFAGEIDVGLRAARQVVTLSPSFALGYLVLGAAYLHAGEPEKAIEPLEHGLRLSPYDPQNFTWLLFLALAYLFSRNPERGRAAAQRSLSLRPGWVAALKVEVMCWVALGDLRRAGSVALSIPASSDAPDSLSRIMAKLDPAWTEQIETAVRRARG